MRLTLPLLLVAGCAPSAEPDEIEVALAEPIPLHIYATDRYVRVWLGEHHPEGAPPSLWTGPCDIVNANLTARLNGVPVPLVNRGGKIGESAGCDEVSADGCLLPTLELDMPSPDGPSTLEVSDPSATLMCRLPDLKAAREVASVPPESGPLTWRPGQQITVQWSPSGDLPLWSSFSAELLHLNATGSGDGTNAILAATLEGDLVHFAIPSVPPGSYVFGLYPSMSVVCGPAPHTADISYPVGLFPVGLHVAIAP